MWTGETEITVQSVWWDGHDLLETVENDRTVRSAVIRIDIRTVRTTVPTLQIDSECTEKKAR